MKAPTVAVFGSAQTVEGGPQWAEAESVGVSLARAGYIVATGGYGGTMEAVSRGARSQGGQTIGVTVPSLFPGRSGANPSITVEVAATTLNDRIGKLLDMSAACIALPGSIGTVAELVVAWNINHVRGMSGIAPTPIAAVGPGWAGLREALVELGASSDHVGWFEVATDAVAWVSTEINHANTPTAI